MPRVGTRYLDRFGLPIPNDRALIGATYYQQWATLYYNCRGACRIQMVRMSDAAKIVVGI